MKRNNPLKIGLIGATGKLGQSIALMALTHPDFSLQAAIAHSQSPHLHLDLGVYLKIKPLGLFITKDPLSTPVDLFIDVSAPQGLSQTLKAALKTHTPLVLGTTGFSKESFQRIQDAASQIPLFYAPNFSLGMALLQKLTAETARCFSFPSDIDLIESHHAQKKDAPSGSALWLKETIQKERPQASLSIHSLRSGSLIGEHTLHFNTEEERITLTHTAHSKKAFARGALQAALFLKQQPPGFYTMEHLLEKSHSLFVPRPLE